MRRGSNTSRAGRRPSTWGQGALVLACAVAAISAAPRHLPRHLPRHVQRGQPEGHGRDGRRPLVSCQVRRRGRRHADGHGDRARHGPRPRAPVGQWRLGPRRLRLQLGSHDRRLGRLRVQRAGGGLRQEGPEAARAGVPLPRQRVERRPVDRLRRDRRALRRQGEDRRRQHAHPQAEAAAAEPRPRSHRARRLELRRGRPAWHRRRAQAARRRLHLRRPDRRSRGALEGRHDRRREVRGVEPQDPAAQRQQRLPPSRGLQPRAQAAGHALSGARQGADAQPPVGRGPRRQRHRDHAEPRRPGRQADLPAAGRPSRA